MDQSADAEKQYLNDGPGSFEVIELSRTFLRPGIATGIDSLCHHLPYVLWTGFHCVPLRNATRTHARRRFDPQSARASTKARSSRPEKSISNDAQLSSLNSEPGCIKVVDTFRFSNLPSGKKV